MQLTQGEMEMDQLDKESDYGEDELHDEGDDEDEDGFKVRNALPQPSSTTFTIRELHHQIHRGTIDLSPSYQRAVVWTEAKQIILIESIFRNFYVPPILFFVQDGEDGEMRVCMDGKQRLSSIQAFMDGQIPCERLNPFQVERTINLAPDRDAVTKQKWYYTAPESLSQGGKRLLLPQKIKNEFANKLLHATEYRHISPDIERDIFQRVQLGVPLTAAEKLAAISSPYADWINELDGRWVSGTDDGINTLIRWNIDHGNQFRGLAQVAYCIERLHAGADVYVSNAKLSTWLRQDDVPGIQLKKEVYEVLMRFWVIARDPKLNMVFTQINKIVSPVEFTYFNVIIAIFTTVEDPTLAQLLYDIRVAVRKACGDTSMQTNSKVIAVFWDLIHRAEDQYKVRHKRTVSDSDEYSLVKDTIASASKRRKRQQKQKQD